MLSVDELAARWGVDRKTLYLQIQRRQLPVVRIGRAIRIPLALIESIEQGCLYQRTKAGFHHRRRCTRSASNCSEE